MIRRLLAATALWALIGCTAGPSAVTRTANTIDERPISARTCQQPLEVTGRTRTKNEELASMRVQLGQEYMQQGAFEVAMREIQQALKLNPRSAEGHHAKALLHQQLGQPGLAEKAFHKALELAPGDPRLNNNYGVFLCERGRYADAHAHFDCAIDNPFYTTPETAYLNAGSCSATAGEYQEAERYLLTALQLAPDSTRALLLVAEAKYMQGAYQPARAYLQRYLTAAPHSPKSLALGIGIEQELGDLDRLASYRLLLFGKFPDSPEAQRLSQP
ncbi:MAG: type IV pilus biogenesis/stability protein PilW [Pseudomonadota bacterium]|nr:type IV pilus biogenesis/stability protein PilW [Pseudomonadota bacterium]